MRNNPTSPHSDECRRTTYDKGCTPLWDTALVVFTKPPDSQAARYISFVRLNSLSAKSSANPEICL